ncbi:MAG: hypothetical protein ACKVS6_07325 [Planctomycetota bacterium]
MTRLIIICRRLPAPSEPFWRLLKITGICAGEFVKNDRGASSSNCEIIELRTPPAPRGEVDPDAAFERRKELFIQSVDALESEILQKKSPLAAFVGISLYISSIGMRGGDPFESDDARDEIPSRYDLTFENRARFGGAACVAIPAATKRANLENVLVYYQKLAALRDELLLNKHTDIY